MIKQLQRRFIRIAVVALTVAMVLVVGIVNIANWISVRGELYNTLSLLVPPESLEEEPDDPVTPLPTPETDSRFCKLVDRSTPDSPSCSAMPAIMS